MPHLARVPGRRWSGRAADLGAGVGLRARMPRSVGGRIGSLARLRLRLLRLPDAGQVVLAAHERQSCGAPAAHVDEGRLWHPHRRLGCGHRDIRLDVPKTVHTRLPHIVQRRHAQLADVVVLRVDCEVGQHRGRLRHIEAMRVDLQIGRRLGDRDLEHPGEGRIHPWHERAQQRPRSDVAKLQRDGAVRRPRWWKAQGCFCHLFGAVARRRLRVPRVEEEPWQRRAAREGLVLCALGPGLVHAAGQERW
mmetsp:Transcript_72705/g.210508  ORF Transcript_72705/g.210508 Transcript_72705/m.210508 type:complete len:249 (-) Transcript_72705:585-1331(-)